MATLPVVIGDTEAVYLYGLGIIAQHQSERLYYVRDGLGSVRQGERLMPFIPLFNAVAQER